MITKLHEATVMPTSALSVDQRNLVTEGITRVILKIRGSQQTRQDILAALVTPLIQRGMQSLSSGAVQTDAAVRKLVADTPLSWKTVAMYLNHNTCLQYFLNTAWPFLEALGESCVGQPRVDIIDALFGLFGVLFISAKELLLPRLPGILTAAVGMYRASGTGAPSCLDCIAKSVEVYARSHAEFKESFLEMFNRVSVCTFEVASSSPVGLKEHPETLQAYYDMVYRYFLFCPDALFASSSFPSVIRLAIASLSCGSHERNSMRSVLSFLSGFSDANSALGLRSPPRCRRRFWWR